MLIPELTSTEALKSDIFGEQLLPNTSFTSRKIAESEQKQGARRRQILSRLQGSRDLPRLRSSGYSRHRFHGSGHMHH